VQVIRLFFPDEEEPYVDNLYDSLSTYSTRFSFICVAAARVDESAKGLISIVQQEAGRRRFITSLDPEADFVIMSAGTHEVAGNLMIEDFDKALPILFDIVYKYCPKIAQQRERFVWRSALPLMHPIKNEYWPDGLCSNEANAAIHWLGYLGGKHATNRNMPVMDAHRLCFAENYELVSKGLAPCTSDGIHFHLCNCNLAQAELLLHYWISNVVVL
jgi:hypothetical protein